MVPPADDPDDTDDLDSLLSIEPRSGRRARRPEREAEGGTREPVRRWRPGGDRGEDEDDLDEGAARKAGEGKRPVFWRARDSLYFEPLVALAIIVLLLVSLFAYTSNWPPVYVVESNSMQHGSGDHLGYINAGDIVLAQRASQGSIITYMDALSTGYSTYGELGDVIIYSPNGTASTTPIIHRAILYMQWVPGNSTYNVSSLVGLPCGTTGDYRTVGAHGGPCATSGLSFSTTLVLYNIGGRTVSIGPADWPKMGGHSGFLTLGDNNSQADQLFSTPLSSLVKPGWVIGVARGMIPWFGALKLLLDGNSAKVPPASWEYLGLTVAGVIFAAAGLHFLLRRRRELRLGRRGRYDEDEEEDLDEAPRARRSSTGLRAWKAEDEPPPSTGRPAPRPARRLVSHEERRRSHFVSSREYRPARRHNKEEPRTPKDDDDEGT